MKLSEYMSNITEVEATGERIGRHMVLAVDCTEAGDAKPDEMLIVAYHIDNVGASLSAGTKDTSYIGEGESTIKTNTKRSFSITGQRLVGEAFQEFCLSHKIKYGVGSAVKRGYVYFDAGTKTGEKGVATISVAKDGVGAAGEPTDVQIDMAVNGIPEEYTYAAQEG